MGPEAVAAFEVAAPYIFGAGTAATMVGQHEQQRQQRNIINRAATQTEDDQAKGAAQAIAEADTMTADQRGQSMQAEQQAAFDRAQADVGGAGGATVDAAPPGGGSAAYIKLKGERDTSEGERMTAVARELSKLRGVGSAQQAEATRRSALAERLGSMWSSGRQRTQAAGLDADSVDMPTYGQIGQLAQLVGGAGMMSGGAAAAGGASSASTMPAMAEMSGAGSSMAAAPVASSAPSIWGRAAVLASPMWQQRRSTMFSGGAR